MSKTTGKLKYDLALSSTTLYDATSIYVNKSAELSLNGNANLTYKTIGATYAVNGMLLDPGVTENGTTPLKGKAYLYIRNLGPAGQTAGAPIRLSMLPKENNEEADPAIAGYTGQLNFYDDTQFSELNVGEFTFFPITINVPEGKGEAQNLYVRSAYDPGPESTWPGATYNDIEYGVILTDHNIGPGYGSQLIPALPGDPGGLA